MTKQKFISRIERWRKHQTRTLVVFFTSIAFAYGVWFLAMSHFDTSEPSTPLRIGWASVPFALAVTMVVGHRLVLRHTFKRHGMSCLACGKPLGGIEAVVIATGNCGNCGERILEDEQENPAVS